MNLNTLTIIRILERYVRQFAKILGTRSLAVVRFCTTRKRRKRTFNFESLNASRLGHRRESDHFVRSGSPAIAAS